MPLKLLCRGKVITNNPGAALETLGLTASTKLIVMRGAASSPDQASGMTTSDPSTPSEVERILKAVEAVSSRAANPHKHHFQLCDQVELGHFVQCLWMLSPATFKAP
jgi:hypothetical protein